MVSVGANLNRLSYARERGVSTVKDVRLNFLSLNVCMGKDEWFYVCFFGYG